MRVKRWNDELIEGALKLFSGLFFAQLFHLFFQMAMGRLLLPEEFALLASVLGLLHIFTFPMGVLSTAMTRYVRLLVAENRSGDVRRLMLHWCMRMGLIGAILFSICLFYPTGIGAFFHLDRAAPVYILGVVLIGIFMRPVVNGTLLGLELFTSWSICMSVGALIRLIVGVLLVMTMSPFAGWGLLGHGIGFYGALFIGLWIVYRAMGRASASDQSLPTLRGYVSLSFVVMLGLAVFLSGDLVLVKRLFPEAAAHFAYAATLGHAVVLLPSAVVGAMFPKVVGEGSASAREQQLLLRALMVCLLCAGITALGLHITAPFLPSWIFGLDEVSTELISWLRGVAWAMVPVSLVSALMRFGLARNQLGVTLVIPLMSGLFIGYCGRYAADPGALICALALSASAALLILGIRFLWGIPRR